MNDEHQHYQMAPRRKAEFVNPPNHLKAKVGNGSLSEDILNKAQALLEKNTIDFTPLGEMYLDAVMKGIEQARTPPEEMDNEVIIAGILFPTMQLKANGGMFHYDLITRISDRIIQFLEVVESIDNDALEIILAYHTTIRAILLGKIQGDGGDRGLALMNALIEACYRYFEKHPDKKR